MKFRVKKWMGLAALSTAMTIGAAGGFAYSQMTHADLVKAETANYYAERSNVFSGTGTLTQTESAKFTLTGVKAGQYSVTVEITKTEGTSQDWFYLSATGLGDAVFLNEGTVSTGKYYGVVNVGEDGTLTISSTSPNTLYVNVSLDTLFMNEDSGYSLGNIHFASRYSPINIDVSGTQARTFTVQVDLGDHLLGTGETLRANINGASAELAAQTPNLAIYSATISLPQTVTSATTLTIESTVIESEDESVVGSVALFPLGTVTPMTTNTATAENIGLWETAIFSYTPSVSGYRSVEITSNTENVESVEVSTTVALTAGTYSGTPVSNKDYPVYLNAGTTYYFESVLTGITPVEGYEGEEITKVDLTITLSDWKAPAEVTTGTFAMPVTPTEEFSTKLNVTPAGQYSLTIIDAPFDYYDRNVVITAHLGTRGIELNRDNNYSAIVDIAGGETIYFTTSENTHTTLTFSLAEYHEVHYIELDTATEITVPANGAISYYVQAAASGAYSITLTGDTSTISVYGDNVQLIPAGATAGGFVVRFDGADYGIEFRNSGNEDVKITATVSVDEGSTLQLGAENNLSLTAGQRRSFFMYSLAAGTYNLTVNPAANLTLTVDGAPITLTDGKATITISNAQEENGVVNFTFENTGATTATFKVTVTPTSNILNVGEYITVTTTEYEYITTYYAMVEAGKSYALSLDLPEGMSVIVTENGENLVFYGGMAGAFTAQYTGYVTLRFSCYNYGDKTEFTAYFNNAGVMSVFEEVSVTVNANDKQYSYVTYLYDGRYHFDLSNSAVKVAINGTVLTEDSFELYNYDKVTVTFIYDGEGAFNATLVPEYTLTLGTTADITLDGWVNRSYYTNLNAGTYEVTIADASNLQLQIDGVLINAVNANTYVFTVTENGYHAITFMNADYNTITFKATIATANVLNYNVPNSVTIEEGTHSKTYYIDLSEGNYNILLVLPDGTSIQVSVNDTVVVAYGSTIGTFTITEDQAGFVQVTFTTESDAAVTFMVRIYAA